MLNQPAALTVVRGPVGSGKTTLVSDWITVQAKPSVWISAETAGTRHLLWKAAIAGLTCLDPRFSVLQDTLESVADLRSALTEAVSLLLEPVVLVIDDVDQYDDDPEVAEDLLALIDSCPQLRIVVTARHRGYLEGGLVGSRVERTVITPSYLRLTVTESTQILQQGLGSGTNAAKLHALCEGSPLLLRAVMVGLQSSEPGESIEDVAEAVVRDLLRGVPAERRAFMLSTCVPEEFDATLAGSLSGMNPQPHLEALEAAGLLTASNSPQGTLWRYHTMIRQSLLDSRRESATIPDDQGRYAADVLHQAHRETARWYQQRGKPEVAVNHALAAEDLQLVSSVLLRNGLRLISQPGALERLKPLAPKDVARYPLIALILGVGCYARRSRRIKAGEYFLTAIAGAKLLTPRASHAEKAALATVEALAFRLAGHAVQGVPAARRALKLLLNPEVDLSPLGDQVGWMRVQNALTLIRAAHPREAWPALQENLAFPETLTLSSQLQTLGAVAMLQAFDGDLHAAEDTVAEAQKTEVPTDVRNGYVGALLHFVSGILALEKLDIQSARAHVQALAPHMETIEFRPYFVALEASADLVMGNPAQGLQRISRLSRSHGREKLTGFERQVLGPLQVLLYLAEGQGAAAEQVLHQLPRTVNPQLARLLRALHCHLTGDYEQVTALLTDLTGGTTPPRLSFFAHLLTAAVALRQAEKSSALHHLQHMLAISAETGLRIQVLLVPAGDLCGLLDLARKHRLPGAEVLDTARSVIPDSVLPGQLTERERVVLSSLAHHSSVAEIAEDLVVSRNTVKSQLRTLYRKLGVAGREEALAVAAAHGLLETASQGDA
ncbi:LuxR C-terminal-related transcriptional regulator [Nesterenkonia rhizosphaerae]